MSGPPDDIPFPRTPLIAVAALLAFALLAAAVGGFTGLGRTHSPDAAAVSERSLRYEDRPDGSIVVTDARDGQIVASIAPGTNGFLRGTLRGLARERKRQGIGAEQPFQLVARADGRLTLIDPATGRRVDLESFGPTNTTVFAQLLESSGTRR
jgi:putative photosynthetic complex assembly protein